MGRIVVSTERIAFNTTYGNGVYMNLVDECCPTFLLVPSVKRHLIRLHFPVSSLGPSDLSFQTSSTTIFNVQPTLILSDVSLTPSSDHGFANCYTVSLSIYMIK